MVYDLPVKVYCKRCPGSIRTIYIHAAKAPDGQNFGLSNGCDEQCGDPACEDCIAKASELFNAGESFQEQPFSLP